MALSTQAAFAICTKPKIDIVIPSGDVSSMAQMKAGRESVQDAVNRLQGYQSCLNKAVAALPATDSNAKQLKLAWLAQGDAAIDYAQHLAARFSRELHKFNSRSR